MDEINLKWARSDNKHVYNFGDDLGPYIIKKLSGKNIRYIHYANTRMNVTRKFLSDTVRGKFSLRYLVYYFRSFFTSNYIISIGSIIQWYGSSRCVVWGSGIMNKTDRIKKSKFLAVRGEYTKSMIKKLGFTEPQVMGDPALLVPLLYSPNVPKRYKLGIIPHMIHYEDIKKRVSSEDVLIIRLNNSNIEMVIDEINSCEYTISTSLHGLIVSHAYNIKSLWYKYDGISLAGDDVKFLDYFSSVGIAEYKPFILPLFINPNEIVQTIAGCDKVNHINSDLSFVQQQLINIAPFPVKAEFKRHV